MNRSAIIWLAVVVALIIVGYFTWKKLYPQDAQKNQQQTVTIENFAYNPSTLTIKAGTPVIFINKDEQSHTVTGNGFDSGEIAKDQSYTYTFDKAGTFEYNCTIHPDMKGTVIVE